MKLKFLQILITLIIFVSLPLSYIYAIEFKTEQEKGVWIKNFFKDKEIEMGYPDNATKKEKAFEYQFIHDFVNQRNIQNIESIAQGSSLLDPEIAKYNTACPDKKPIDMYKEWDTLFNSEESDEEIEKTLEDPNNEYAYAIDIYRCHGNMKIYNIDIDKRVEKEQYILYCDDQRFVRLFAWSMARY